MTNIRILLVEDNPDDRLLIMRGIKKGLASSIILEAHKQRHLSEAIDKGNFDIVITDYNLGWTNGISVLKSVKEKWPRCPVIMMTVMDTEEVAIKAMNAGLDNYIVKSSSQFALMAETIRSALEVKEQAKALQEAEIRYQELFDSVPIGLFRVTENGTLLNVNQSLVEILNYPSKEVLLQVNTRDLYVNPEERIENFTKLAKEKILHTRETQLKRYDGTIIITQITVGVILGPNREIVYFDGYLRDISEHRRVEEALSHSEVLNETIIASVQDGVMVTDRDLKIVVWNPYLERLSGLSQEDLVNTLAIELLDQTSENGAQDALRRALLGETIYTPDTPYHFSKSGRQGWIQSVYAPLRTRQGEVVGVVVNIHDITQRKENETEREQLLTAEQKRSRELAALTTASTTISSNLDINQVLQVVAEQMIQLLNIDSCTISSWNEDRDSITPLVEYRPGKQTAGSTAKPSIDVSDLTEIKLVLNQALPLQITLANPALTPALREQMKINHARSMLFIPLIHQQHTIGLIALEDHLAQRTFSDQEIFLAQMLGNQAAVALENARLFNETKENLRREQKLHEISRAISVSLDLESVIRTTNQLVTDLFDADISSILTVDPETLKPGEIWFHNAPPDAPTNPPDGKGVVWEIIKNRQPLLIPDYANYHNPGPFWLKQGLKSTMAVPLEAGNVFIGVLAVFTKDPNRQFTPRDLDLAISVGRQASVALHKALLYDETHRRSEELSALYDIALATGSVLDTPTLIKQLQNKIEQLIAPDSYEIFLYHKEADSIEIVTAQAKNIPLQDAIGVHYPLDEGDLISDLVSKRQTILIDDLEQEETPKKLQHFDLPIRSFLGIPFIAGDNLLGALAVQSFEPYKFVPENIRFLESIAAQVSIALDNARLYEELEDAFVQTVVALANAVDVRDTYTHDHSQRIAVLALATGRQMGLGNHDIETLRWAALLHDIGKIGISDNILLKPGPLTKEEYEEIKKHPSLGAEIVAPVKKLRKVAPVIRTHQERYDGQGYPDGLEGKQIPLTARILSVVDSYVAITDERIYRKARSHQEAIREITDLAGKQYDPQVVKAFLEVIEEFKEQAYLKKVPRS